MEERKTLKFKKDNLYINVYEYANNGRIAIFADTEEEAFADITVNLPNINIPPYVACINDITKSCGLEQKLIKEKLIKKIDTIKYNLGEYDLVEINFEKLMEYDLKGTRRFIDRNTIRVEEKYEGTPEEIIKSRTGDIIEVTENFINDNEEYKDFKIEYILLAQDEKSHAFIYNKEESELVVYFPYEAPDNKVLNIEDWDLNHDTYIFESLENDMEIGLMSMNTHYKIWNEIEMAYPDKIDHKEGVQKYLKYCKKNNITKEIIVKETGKEVMDIMRWYKKESIKKNEKNREGR